MVYRVIGLMSGSSLDGIDIVFAELNESGGKWNYEIKASACYEYAEEWIDKLKNAATLSAYNYLLLHSAYGKYLGEKINEFINGNQLQHKVQLVASHGHTTFHAPALGMTAQLGDGAAIAAATGINVVSDLRALDVAFGGEGAPIVPMGEKLLLHNYDCFLNIGGIANISFHGQEKYIAYDVCAANRVLNLLAEQEGLLYDKGGELASKGKLQAELLKHLNELDYYKKPFPKSLANEFGTEIVFPLIQSYNPSTADALRTYAEHIVQQIVGAIKTYDYKTTASHQQLLITGGGAFNNCLVHLLTEHLKVHNIEVVIPDEQLVKFKEALIMALLGVLRWREENTVMSSVTGAVRSSIGGAVWIGQEA